MKKFLRRIGKTRFLILCFIPFGVWGLYSNGLLGLLAAMFGWYLGNVIYNWKEYKPRLIRFLKRRTKFQIQMMFFLPIAAACIYCYGWIGLIGSIVGWCIGELICRKLFR